ncbi:MAG TPA: hypothetical protein VD833_08935 [Vicinamibacterales bacterium]|nr:hypothetical protein [Vicinamibacterales bacterium]
MLKRTLCTIAAVVMLVAAARAQTTDELSGRWGAEGATFLDLAFDGKGGVSGTVFWRAGGQAVRTPVRKGSFRPDTRTLRLEGEGPRPDGTVRGYVIEGVLAGDTISGRYSIGDDSGEFTFSRITRAAGTRSPDEMRADFDAHKGDFDYLLGDWEFTADSKEYGSFRGYWSAVRLDEGQILDEYRIVGDKGETYYVTTTLRNYNRAMGRWELIGADAGTGLQDFGTGRKVGDEIHIEQKFGVTSDTPSVWRIRYHDIRADAFSWTADRSDDGGRTWERDFQKIEARRIGPARNLGPLAVPRQ